MSDRIECHLRITVEMDRITEQFQGTLQHIEEDIHSDRIAGLLPLFFRCLRLQQSILYFAGLICDIQLCMIGEGEIRHPEIAVSCARIYKPAADE